MLRYNRQYMVKNYDMWEDENDIVSTYDAVEKIREIIGTHSDKDCELLRAYRKDFGFTTDELFDALKYSSYSETYNYAQMEHIGRDYKGFVKNRDKAFKLMVKGEEDTKEYKEATKEYREYMYCTGMYMRSQKEVREIIATILDERPFKNHHDYDHRKKYGENNSKFKKEVINYTETKFIKEMEYIADLFGVDTCDVPLELGPKRRNMVDVIIKEEFLLYRRPFGGEAVENQIHQAKHKLFESGLLDNYCATSQHMIHREFKTLFNFIHIAFTGTYDTHRAEALRSAIGETHQHIKGIIFLVKERNNTCKTGYNEFKFPGRK